MDLPEKLKKLRIDHNLTVEQVGTYLGVSKSAISKWENGETEDIGRKRILQFAELYNTSPMYLLGWDENNKKPAGKAGELRDELFAKLMGFSEEQLQMMLSHAELVESALRKQTKK